MAKYTLVLLETTGIQEYVFGSNHLAQNIGASSLVFRVTTEWIEKALNHLSSNIDRSDVAKGLLLNDRSVSAHGIDVEIIYAGGGNALLMFRQKNQASNFIQALSQTVLKKARGLQIIAMQEPVDWPETETADEGDAVARVHNRLRQKLAAKKSSQTVSAPQLGLGVTATCVFTGFPALGYNDEEAVVGAEAAAKVKTLGEEEKLVSAEVAHKLAHEELGRDRLKAVLPKDITERFDLVYDFDEFGTKGESNYLAVVHVDGNNMGDRFDKLARSHDSPAQNQAYLNALRQFSESIRKISLDALEKTAGYLFASLKTNKAGKKFGGVVPIPRRGDQDLFPFRPIIFGGDDITFVTEGRLGLSLAAKFLQELSKETLADGQPLFAKAGVAVANAHFPFARTYQLAEALCRRAKAQMIEKELVPAGQASANVLDWHFSTTGINLSLRQITDREYTSQKGHPLQMRPIRVDPPSGNGSRDTEWQTWQTLTDLVGKFQNSETWAGRRNKVLALRAALRKGREAVTLFKGNYRIETLPDIPPRPDMARTGWQGNRCGYYDAIEALDFFVALEPNSKTTPEGEAVS